MYLFLKYIFCVSFILHFLSFAKSNASNTCTNYLLEKSSQLNLLKPKQRLKKLDPVLYQTALDLKVADDEIKLYIFLKSKAWQILPFGSLPWKKSYQLSDETKQNLLNEYGHQYRISELSQDHLTIFYANHLQSIYSSLVQLIYENRIIKIQNKFRFKINDPKIKKYIMAILEKEIAVDLRQAHVEPNFANSLLQQNNYLNFDWPNIISTLMDFLSNVEIELISSFKMLSEDEKQILRLVFQNSNLNTSKDLCCKNSSGCVFCPNNLGFINPK